MKTWILAIMVIVGVAMNAQSGERRHEGKRHGKERMEQFTPEQKTELQVKRMTLALDLTDKQQKEIKSLFLERGKEREKMMAEMKADREAGKKPTADERFARKNRILDNKITMKASLKKILDEKQLAKLEDMKKHKREKITKRGKSFKMRGRR